MRKYLDGVEVINGVEMLGSPVNLFPVLKGLGEILGEELMTDLLHECLGEEAMFYPNYSGIGLGNSKGWAKLPEQLKLINYIVNRFETKDVCNYKGWYGVHHHLMVR